MLSKNDLKFITSLQKKKFRQNYNKFIAEGDKICREIIKDYASLIDSIYVTDNWANHIPHYLEAKTTYITPREIKSISSQSTNSDVLIILDKTNIAISEKSNFSLLLDNIQDPGNLGTMIRIADWFGIKEIFCSTGCVDWTNSKVIQSTMGSFLRVKINENVQLADLIKTSGHHVYAGLLSGKPLKEAAKNEKGYILIGNESNGISADIEPLVDFPVCIEGSGEAESLNAAIATGIICHHLLG